MDDRPVFVVGAQRSGTTLVRLLLDAHPRIAIGPETAFLKHVAEGAKRMQGGNRSRRTDAFDVSPDAAERELAAAWVRILKRHARLSGARRWGDKSPVHRYHGDRIRRLFPGAQVVAVVRHPGAVALSRAKWGYDPEVTIRDWATTVGLHMDDAARFGDRAFLLVRYEDLLRDPEPQLRRLVAFLGEPWDQAVLRRALSGDDDGQVTDGGTRTDEPVDPARAVAWVDRADEQLLAQLDEQAAQAMAVVGYRSDLADPVGSLPDSVLTAPPTLATRGVLEAVRDAVADRGLLTVLRRAAVETRRNGPAAALRRARRP